MKQVRHYASHVRKNQLLSKHVRDYIQTIRQLQMAMPVADQQTYLETLARRKQINAKQITKLKIRGHRLANASGATVTAHGLNRRGGRRFLRSYIPQIHVSCTDDVLWSDPPLPLGIPP